MHKQLLTETLLKMKDDQFRWGNSAEMVCNSKKHFTKYLWILYILNRFWKGS